jgi:hypothetical protein
MPERENFLSYIEPGRQIFFRKKFVDHICALLSLDSFAPAEIMRLDTNRETEETQNWEDGCGVIDNEIRSSEIVFIYFSREGSLIDRHVLSIIEREGGVIFNLSLSPTATHTASDKIIEIISGLYQIIVTSNFKGLVAVGRELEFEGDSRSLEDAVRSLKSKYSLASWLCIPKSGAIDHSGFTIKKELFDAVILRRAARN